MWVILILVSPSFRPVVESVPCTCRSRCGSRPRTGPWRSLGFGPNAARAAATSAPPAPPARRPPLWSAYPVAFGLRSCQPVVVRSSVPLRAGPTPEHCPRLVLSIICPAGLISWGPRSHFGSRLLRLRCGDLICLGKIPSSRSPTTRGTSTTSIPVSVRSTVRNWFVRDRYSHSAHKERNKRAPGETFPGQPPWSTPPVGHYRRGSLAWLNPPGRHSRVTCAVASSDWNREYRRTRST